MNSRHTDISAAMKSPKTFRPLAKAA